MKIVELALIFIVLQLLICCDQRGGVKESGTFSEPITQSNTAELKTSSFIFYGEMLDKIEAVLCVGKLPVIHFLNTRTNKFTTFMPINGCEASGAVVDMKRNNIFTITQDSVKTAKETNGIDRLNAKLAEAYLNNGRDPFLPSNSDKLIIVIALDKTDSIHYLTNILSKLTRDSTGQHNIWLRYGDRKFKERNRY